MARWDYIGDPGRVSECEYRGVVCDFKYGYENEDCCLNGSCPGHIDGDCRFWGENEPNDEYKHLFVKTRYVPIAELVSKTDPQKVG